MGVLKRLVIAGVATLTLVGAGTATAFAHEGGGLLQFDSMTGIAQAQTKIANDRGIVGGGLPWVIGPSSGEVSRHGSVEVKVTGLVIPALGNVNPINMLAATVSCKTEDGTVNVSTKLFPATKGGDVIINDQVKLPHDCGSPEVFITGPSGAWFAVSNTNNDDREGND
jgi:hypothetical protein